MVRYCWLINNQHAPEVNCAQSPITSTIVLSTPARAASKAF